MHNALQVVCLIVAYAVGLYAAFITGHWEVLVVVVALSFYAASLTDEHRHDK